MGNIKKQRLVYLEHVSRNDSILNQTLEGITYGLRGRRPGTIWMHNAIELTGLQVAIINSKMQRQERVSSRCSQPLEGGRNLKKNSKLTLSALTQNLKQCDQLIAYRVFTNKIYTLCKPVRISSTTSYIDFLLVQR